MKSLIQLILIVFIFLPGCTKEDDYNWGEITATRNGEFWSGKLELFAIENKPNAQGIDIIIRQYNQEGFLREDLFFFKIPVSVGKQQLSPTNPWAVDSKVGADYSTSVDDGDVLGDFYDLLEGEVENFIEIEKIKRKEVWGNFQVAFVKDTTLGIGDPAAPDTIIFTNGHFHTKIFD